MFRLIKLELLKMFSKWRTYIAFIAVGVITGLIQVAMASSGEELIMSITRVLRSTLDFNGDLVNGYMINRIVMQSLFVEIPLLITLVGGDLLSGEATSGTYRLLLIRPASRLKIVAAKYLSGLIYVGLLMFWLMIISLGVGVLFFGVGDMMVVRFNITVIPQDDVLWRHLITYAYGFLGMWVVYSLAFLFSVFVENSIGPIFSTMAVLIIFNIVGLINVGFFADLQPFLFTNHINTWRGFFEIPIEMSQVYTSISVLVLHIIVFTGITFVYFNKRDINS